LVAAQGASSVLEVVVVWTLLEVVGVRVDVARDDLKVKEVKQLDALVRTNVPGVVVSNSRLDLIFLLRLRGLTFTYIRGVGVVHVLRVDRAHPRRATGIRVIDLVVYLAGGCQDVLAIADVIL
jgi:hypothetical protein